MLYSSLAEMLFTVADRFPEKTAYMFKKDGMYQSILFKDVVEKVKNIAGGLAELGVKKGDKVAILSENRLNWALVDYAILTLNAVNVPIYPSLLPKQVDYLLNDSRSVIVIASNENQYNKIKSIRGNCNELKNVVVMDLAESPS